ncbi:unnamed protein product [Calypogeia fissa]
MGSIRTLNAPIRSSSSSSGGRAGAEKRQQERVVLWAASKLVFYAQNSISSHDALQCEIAASPLPWEASQETMWRGQATYNPSTPCPLPFPAHIGHPIPAQTSKVMPVSPSAQPLLPLREP